MAMGATTTLNYKMPMPNGQQTRVNLTAVDIMNEALTARMGLHVSLNLDIQMKKS